MAMLVYRSVSPLGHVLAEINGGDPNHFTSTKMILKKNLGFLLIVLCFFWGGGDTEKGFCLFPPLLTKKVVEINTWRNLSL